MRSTFFFCDKAPAWAREGHQVVAVIAERLISPEALAHARQFLDEGEDKDLASIACWADEVVLAARGEGPLIGNQETVEFNKRFPNSRMWHFVNLPLGTMSYREARKFSSAEDIVRAISRCIEVLESPVVESEGLTKLQALRLLVHLVADIHQPLHCGTGYYRFEEPGATQLITYPTEAFGKPNDRGGNLLFYGMLATEQLHALWDEVIVARVVDSADYHALAEYLLENYLAKEMTKTPGDYHSWAETWAIDSVRVASLAYLGIAFETPEFDSDRNLLRINITLPANYLENNSGYAAGQLTKAGVRLAQLLDAIKWQSVAETEGAALRPAEH